MSKSHRMNGKINVPKHCTLSYYYSFRWLLKHKMINLKLLDDNSDAIQLIQLNDLMISFFFVLSKYFKNIYKIQKKSCVYISKQERRHFSIVNI